MNEKKELNEPLSATYADAKTSVTLAVRNVMKAFPLPIFMFESILSGILGEIRSEANMELSSDVQRYKEALHQSHQSEMKELTEKYKKERAKILGKSILVGLTVAGGVTFATLVAADYKNAKNRLEFIKNEPLSHAKRLGNIENEIGQVTGELRHTKMTDADYKYLKRLDNQKWTAEKDLRDSLVAARKASVAKIMANDVKDDFLSTINGIRNLVSKHIPKTNKSKPQEG